MTFYLNFDVCQNGALEASRLKLAGSERQVIALQIACDQLQEKVNTSEVALEKSSRACEELELEVKEMRLREREACAREDARLSFAAEGGICHAKISFVF